MRNDIIAVEPLPHHRLRLRFEDGREGDVDFPVPFDGVFAALRDPEVFAAVRVHPDLGTIVRPNGADLEPDALYALVTGRPVRLRDSV